MIVKSIVVLECLSDWRNWTWYPPNGMSETAQKIRKSGEVESVSKRNQSCHEQ